VSKSPVDLVNGLGLAARSGLDATPGVAGVDREFR
jgi:hypothetical protein